MAKIVTEADFFRVLGAEYPKYFLSLEHAREDGPAAYVLVVEIGQVLYDVTGATLLECMGDMLDHLGL